MVNIHKVPIACLVRRHPAFAPGYKVVQQRRPSSISFIIVQSGLDGFTKLKHHAPEIFVRGLVLGVLLDKLQNFFHDGIFGHEEHIPECGGNFHVDVPRLGWFDEIEAECI